MGVVQNRVLSDGSIARVKIWDRFGQIVYSDKAQLIGKRYPISPAERAKFEEGPIDAGRARRSAPGGPR